MEKTTQKEYCSAYEIKKNIMYWTCGKYGGEER
jgi:hypothetical protein